MKDDARSGLLATDESNDASLVADLQRLLRDRAPGFEPGVGAVARVAYAGHRRASSDVFFFDIVGAAATSRVAVKVPRGPDPFDEGLREHVKFAVANRLVAVSGARCPRALDYLAEVQGLVTERIEARSLGELLRAASRPLAGARARRTLERVVSAAAAWLAGYHELAPIVQAPLNDQYFVYVRGYADFLCGRAMYEGARNALPFAPAQARALDAALDAIEARRGEILAWYTQGHGDFGPSNVLVDDAGSVIVLDCPSVIQRPYLEDVAYFVTSIATSKFALGIPSRTMRRYRERFLHTYLAHWGRTAAAERLLAVLELQATLKVCANQTRSHSGGTSLRARAARYALRLRHARLVARALARVERVLGEPSHAGARR